MTAPDDNFDRLATRMLDDEITANERQALAEAMRADQAAGQRLEELTAVDQAAAGAMRRALKRPAVFTPRRRDLLRGTRVAAALAAAACLGFVVWQPNSVPSKLPQIAKIETTNPTMGTVVAEHALYQETAPALEFPSVKIRQVAHDWILVPGEILSEYFLFEVDRTNTQLVAIRGDF